MDPELRLVSGSVAAQDVRKAILHSLPTAECSLAEVLERTRDTNDEVQQFFFCHSSALPKALPKA